MQKIFISVFIYLAMSYTAVAQGTENLEQCIETSNGSVAASSCLLSTLRDESGNTYEFRKENYLKHGLHTFVYKLINKDNQKGNIKIYEGSAFGDGSGCPFGNLKKRNKLKVATVLHTFIEGNKDVISGIAVAVFAIEVDCDSLKEDIIAIKIRKEKSGFKVERNILKGK